MVSSKTRGILSCLVGLVGMLGSLAILALGFAVDDEVANPMRANVVIGESGPAIMHYSDCKKWVVQYRSMADHFSDRNAFVFRCSRSQKMWCYNLSVLVADPKTTADEHRAIVHLVSAFYTKGEAPMSVCIGLQSSGEPANVAGLLKILQSARELRPDGSDAVWPDSGPLGPRLLPKYIAVVLEKHPELNIDVAQTLEVYGPMALKEAGTLLPLLLSEDPQVVAAAESAIRKMDPDGLAHLCQFNGSLPLTQNQRQAIRQAIERLPVVDVRESDGSEQSETSKQSEVLRQYDVLRKREWSTQWERIHREQLPSATASMSEFDHELARQFCRQQLPGKWWKTIVCATADIELNTLSFSPFIPVLASALYTMPGAHDEILELLRDDDPRIVEGTMFLICHLRGVSADQEYDLNGERVAPHVMPDEFAQVLKRHPHLNVSVAGCLQSYGKHASKQAEALVPHLLSEEVYVVAAMSAVITSLNPEMAKSLEVTRTDFSFNIEYPQTMEPLTTRQRELIESHLAMRQ